MELVQVGLVLLIIVALLLGSGVWIAISLLGIGWIAIETFTSVPTLKAIGSSVWGSSASWTLAALPLFIWMGEILFRTRLSQEMFRSIAPWVGWLPGRLLHVNVLGCAVFAAVSGSSAATVATVGKMSIPELKARGYDQTLAIGSLAGSGTLGLLIPPSIIMIVYAVAAEVSLIRMFIAGILPGALVVALFMGYLVIVSLIRRDVAPPLAEPMSFRQKLAATRELLPILLLIGGVIGSIYLGIATATEAAAMGVIGSLLLSGLTGSLTKDSFTASLMGATRLSCMICFILAGAAFLSTAMSYTGIPQALAAWVGGMDLNPYLLIAALCVLYIIMGCFIDGISMIVLTTSVVLPLVTAAGFDLIWFGIFIILVVEMAQITPPLGFNLFVIQGMTGQNIFSVARAALPFFGLMVLAVVIVTLVPEIATWLPSTMNR
jgi:tripartite ATP-independent transporter DctM subunit